MLPRQPSKVPMMVPTRWASTSASKTLADVDAMARRNASAVSVTLGVASASCQNFKTAAMSCRLVLRIETLPGDLSFMLIFPHQKNYTVAGVIKKKARQE